jgi:asparagine N-glycosylation enzyme membrane subunit Stt3
VLSAGLSQGSYLGEASFPTERGERITLPTLGPAYDATWTVQLMRADGNGMAHFRLVFESKNSSLLHLRLNPTKQTFMAVAKPLTNEADLVEAQNRLASGSVWQEEEEWCYQAQIVSSVKLFEQVEGARLRGYAEPGSKVTLILPLRMRTSGRGWTYRQTVNVSDEGSFELISPYPTETTTGLDSELVGPARIEIGTTAVEVRITESSVQRGDIIKVDEN